MIIGIDPGKSGGIVCLRGTSLAKLAVMPESLPELVTLFRDLAHAGVEHVYLEKAQGAMGPRARGQVGMFNYGKHNGHLEAIMTTLNIPYTLIHPVTWTNTMIGRPVPGHPEDTKTRAAKAAGIIWGKQHFMLKRSRNPHPGLVDAALIGEYGRTCKNRLEDDPGDSDELVSNF